MPSPMLTLPSPAGPLSQDPLPPRCGFRSNTTSLLESRGAGFQMNGTFAPLPDSFEPSTAEVPIASCAIHPACWALTPTMLGTTSTILGTTPTMLGTTPTMLGTTPTMLGTTPTMLGTAPTMLGTTPTPYLGITLPLPC